MVEGGWKATDALSHPPRIETNSGLESQQGFSSFSFFEPWLIAPSHRIRFVSSPTSVEQLSRRREPTTCSRLPNIWLLVIAPR